MQSMSLEGFITEAVYNAPHPLTLSQLAEIVEYPNQSVMAAQVMTMVGDGLIDLLVEDGITYFIP